MRFYYTAPEHGSVGGTVTNVSTGSPVEGASVQVGGFPPVTTNAAGEYLCENIITGVHPITCVMDGYYDYESEVEVIVDETTTHDIDFVPNLFGNLDGTVTDVDTGDPIEGAEITATSDFEVEYTTTTGTDGSYFIEDMIAGDYIVSCEATNYQPISVPVTILVDETVVQDFELIWAEEVEFTVTLTDDYGDGWNGGWLDVYVNSELILDAITIATGAGPEDFILPCATGDFVEILYTAGGGHMKMLIMFMTTPVSW